MLSFATMQLPHVIVFDSFDESALHQTTTTPTASSFEVQVPTAKHAYDRVRPCGRLEQDAGPHLGIMKISVLKVFRRAFWRKRKPLFTNRLQTAVVPATPGARLRSSCLPCVAFQELFQASSEVHMHLSESAGPDSP
jgi:hypothetical protein